TARDSLRPRLAAEPVWAPKKPIVMPEHLAVPAAPGPAGAAPPLAVVAVPAALVAEPPAGVADGAAGSSSSSPHAAATIASAAIGASTRSHFLIPVLPPCVSYPAVATRAIRPLGSWVPPATAWLRHSNNIGAEPAGTLRSVAGTGLVRRT